MIYYEKRNDMRMHFNLLIELIKSDLKTRYKNTVLGFLWVLFEPLFIMSVLYIVFSKFMRFQMDYYALYLLSGITAWRLFVNATGAGMQSFYRNREMVLKVKLPRMLIPLSAVLSGAFTAFFEFFIYIMIFIIFKHTFTPVLLLFIPFLIMFTAMIAGISIILSVLYVLFRDIKPAWEILVQVLFFLCPIFYPLTLIPMRYYDAYLLNPIAVYIMGFHDILYYSRIPDTTILINSILFTAIILIISVIFFIYAEKRMVKNI